ncbi:hypothetical protein SBOR_9964 [Sclerotinia borealis F-4128]|uniref:Uncharacterized protein n=1 Tax=Sclerotinia borealis (strain F-4128) TaxID=1432307 RepID=W9BYI1_SCLBF|nr:hypothetical protein SBOR_9964 [Sclerotinia borealis F-4128]
MAHYQGWNQKELSKARKGQEDRTYIAPETPMRPISSFTPINQGFTNNFDQKSPLTRTVDPLRTLRNTDIYDLPDDIPILPTSSGPKPRSKNSRAKTLSGLESHNNFGLEDSDSGQFEVSSPKRRKIPVKGAQPAFKIPSKVQTNVSSKGLSLDDGSSASQLNTPPDTHKRPKKRVSSAMVSKRKKSSELFQSSTITKPSLSYFASKSPRDEMQSINRLQGFTTTEEQLKLNSNGIANTTLQKLASFRYVPRNDNPSAIQPLVASKIANTQGALDQYLDGQVLEEAKQPASDYGPISSDSYFEEALWIPKQFADSNEPEITCPNLSEIHSFSRNPMNSQHISDYLEYSPKQSEYAPTSSEVRVLENVPDGIAVKVIEMQDLSQGPLSVDNNAATQLGDIDFELPDHSIDIQRVYIQSPGPEQDQANLSNDSTLLMPMARPGRHHTDNQLERSYIEVGEPAPKNPFRDDFDSDDFDHGIGDEDLLALVADPVIPETPMKSQTVQGTAILSSPSSVQYKLDLAGTRTLPSPHLTAVPQKVTRATSSSIVMDEDDDFPMDADLEEEMFRLAETSQVRGVVESFEPPPSLKLPFDGHDTDRELYDNTLQFSSPTSRGSDPGGISRIYPTDISSPSKPPATNEDADWGYITSTAMDPVRAPAIEPLEVLASLSEDKQSKDPPPPVVSSETNSTKIWLDDSHEYLPLSPFARPRFSPLVQDRCPVNGLSAQTFLRVCFRIGEMLKEGGRCNALGQDAIVELFARINFSSREPGTTKQHFQFADLFHDRPPFAKGILANFKTTGLAESESKVFIESSETLMARCLGRVKRDVKNEAWLLHIINIRVTDWEEIRWTKRIVCEEYEEKSNTNARL